MFTYLCLRKTTVALTAIGPITAPKMISAPATTVYAEINGVKFLI